MKAYIHEFTVEGSGNFPLDMLRYDGCYPYESEDVERMTTRGERRQVKLISIGPRGDRSPTEGRWESFGWRVVTKTERPTSW